MKRLLLLSLGLLIVLCSCTPVSPSYTPEDQKDVYTNELKKQISDSIESEMSIYGFDYSIYVFEKDNKLDISIDLSRSMTGAEEIFVNTIEWGVTAVKKAKELYAFEMGELCITFILFTESLNDEASATMKYTTTTFEKGDVFCTYPNMVVKSKKNATVDEIRAYLTGRPAKASAELLNTVSEYQGEWQRGKYGKAIISEDTVNFVHEYDISGKEYVSVNTFYFAFDSIGKLVITNPAGQPRYDISLLENGTLQIKNINSDDEPEVYTKISTSTVVPAEKDDPKIGMTEYEVYSSAWGYPKKKNTTTTANGTREQWVYDYGYIYFTNGIVTAIQEK